MAGQKFQYDESGSTFFYFILSFLALILIPATIYFWPKKKKEGKRQKITVNCKTFHEILRNRDENFMVL
jgi:preprotein translocase subunit Sec63